MALSNNNNSFIKFCFQNVLLGHTISQIFFLKKEGCNESSSLAVVNSTELGPEQKNNFSTNLVMSSSSSLQVKALYYILDGFGVFFQRNNQLLIHGVLSKYQVKV